MGLRFSRPQSWQPCHRLHSVRLWTLAISPAEPWKLSRQHGTLASLGTDFQLAAQPPHPLLHSEQTQAARLPGIEPPAVVANSNSDVSCRLLELHPGAPSTGVPGSVVERLLGDPIDADLILFRQIIGDAHSRGRLDLHFHFRAPRNLSR